MGGAGSDERLGGPRAERAFITRLTGGRQAGRAASGRARKEAEAGARIRGVCLTHCPISSRLFTSTLLLDFLELRVFVGAGRGRRIWVSGDRGLSLLLRLGE